VSEARLDRAPWEYNAHARAHEQAVRPEERGATSTQGGNACSSRSAEADVDVVKRPIPRSCRAEPKIPWGVHAAQAAAASRERARCGCTQVVWVAEVGWTHRASSAPGGRKTSWRFTEGASREQAREHRLTRGTGGKKANRCAGSRPYQVFVSSACGFRLAGSRYDGRRSRITGYRAFTGKAVRDPSTRRSNLGTRTPQGECVTSSASGGQGVRLGRAPG
jgi:hypothetical protein